MEVSQMAEKVSVIMPTYNCAEYIGDAISSVQAQSYENWELFVIDDLSTDETKLVVAPFLDDHRIHYHCLSQKGGPAAARNWGLRQVKGEYVAFLDSDDLWLPDKLEKQISFMKSQVDKQCYFCCTAYEKMDILGNDLGIVILPPTKADYWKVFRCSNPLSNSTVLYDRRYFGDVQVPLITKRNDFALWLQMLRNGAVAFGMDDITMRYRVRKDSLSHKRIGLGYYHWQLYRHIEKMNLVLCIYGMLCWAFVKGTGIGLRIQKKR